MINCTATDVSCRNSLSIDSILSAQSTLFQTAVTFEPSAGPSEPIRPVRDGSLITSPLDSTAPFPTVTKPLLLSTVLDEAAFAIYGQFPDTLPADFFSPICNATFGQPRCNTIIDSKFYTARPLGGGQIDTRTQLQVLGTDYLWRCSSWTFARNWVAHGGSAYVGQYQIGASYPGNSAVPFCTNPEVVCHEDDIEIVVRPVTFLPTTFLSKLMLVPRSLGRFPTPPLPKRPSSKRCKRDTKLSFLPETPTLLDMPAGQ